MQLNVDKAYEQTPFEGSALESIQKTLTEQGEALLSLGNNFNQLEFHKALSYMYQCKGHIIISGMGKSGLIGRKICATLASTGTPSFFVHPGEAFHGDLGMITKEDVVILISNSGETDEVLQLIPSLKGFANPIISICNNAESTMAKNSNAVLELKMEKETCPNNLAPTTSTTLTTALGDALAIALMHKRGFAPNDFARFHPGGSLGKRLLTQVKDVMTNENLPIVDILDKMNDVIITMNKGRKGLAIVTNNKNLVGVITDGDLRRSLGGDKLLSEFRAQDVMSAAPIVCFEHDMLNDAEEKMQDGKVSSLIVLNDLHLVVGLIDIYKI
ncbi:KpsF/GutQ family sugar-phosphate isomerase [Psychromonas sp. RZ5]|nr:KpsF/GutQ family sugar-phosphate isomerase [Psychromonas sp. RZ5]